MGPDPSLRPRPGWIYLLLWIALAIAGCSAKERLAHPGAPAANLKPQPQDLSGTWLLDAQAGDNVARVLAEARRRLKPGGSTGISGGRGSKKSEPSSIDSGPDREFRRYFQPRRLVISHQEPRLEISWAGGPSRRLYTDNRGASVSALGAESQPVATAGWEGATLVVESQVSGEWVVDRYTLLQAPRRLELVSELPDWGQEDEPLRVRRVWVPAP